MNSDYGLAMMTDLGTALAVDRETLEDVILVDEADRPIGVAEKMAAHRSGALHRAFSVMIFDGHGRLLLQQRHIGKYHSGGLWTNSCCGHPRPNENVAAAAARRLREEMGFSTDLTPIGTFTYRAELERGLVEHELVHIFRGTYSGVIAANPAECDGYTWMRPAEIERAVAATPARYSAWFKKYVAATWPLANS